MLAASDDVGRQLQDAALIGRRKNPRSKKAATATDPPAVVKKISKYPEAQPRPLSGVRETSLDFIDDYRAQMDALFNAQDDEP